MHSDVCCRFNSPPYSMHVISMSKSPTTHMYVIRRNDSVKYLDGMFHRCYIHVCNRLRSTLDCVPRKISFLICLWAHHEALEHHVVLTTWCFLMMSRTWRVKHMAQERLSMRTHMNVLELIWPHINRITYLCLLEHMGPHMNRIAYFCLLEHMGPIWTE